jgi:hypothetical protein
VHDEVETVHAMAAKKSANEVIILENTLAGKFDDKSWIDERRAPE